MLSRFASQLIDCQMLPGFASQFIDCQNHRASRASLSTVKCCRITQASLLTAVSKRPVCQVFNEEMEVIMKEKPMKTVRLFKKSVGLILALLLLIGSLAGCGSKGDNPSKDGASSKEVTLNEVAHSIFYAPMYVAIEEGYFEEEGIDLTLVTGFGADKTMTAVLTNEADIGFMGSESTIYTYAGDTQDYVVNFAQLTQRAGNFLVSRQPIENFSWDMIIGSNVLGGRAGGRCQTM